jgi:hypothetical protein
MTLKVATLDCLYPRNSFFCGRTTRAMMGWNVANADALPAYRLDATPAQLIGFAGDLPFVAHEAASTPLVLAFLRHCGLPGPKDLRRYQTAEEAADIASNLISQGKRLVHNFGTLARLLECPVHAVVDQDSTKRDKATADPFCEGNYVRRDIEMINAHGFAGSPGPRDDLINDHQNTVAVADFTNSLEVSWWRDEGAQGGT